MQVELELTRDQAGAVARAVAVGEALSSGEWSVVADLAREGLLVGQSGTPPVEIDSIDAALVAAVDSFRSATAIPIFASKPVGYDAESRSMPTEALPAFCEALDRFVRIGLGQFVILDELGRDEVFSAKSVDSPSEIGLDGGAEFVGLANYMVGHPPRSSHSIGSKHLNEIFKRAYEVYKVARRHQAELSGDADNPSSVHGDGLVVRYTQDPAPAIRSAPTPSPSF